MIMIIQYILLIIFYKPPQKVRKVKTIVVLIMMRRFKKVSFGSEILAKKLNIQKVVVYVTDLDEKLICQYRILRSTRTNGQIEDWNKKINLLRFAAYGFVAFFVHFWK